MSELNKRKSARGGLTIAEIRTLRLDETYEPLTPQDVKFLDAKLLRKLTDRNGNPSAEHNLRLLNDALKS